MTGIIIKRGISGNERKLVRIGDSLTVFKCGSGLTIFAEPAKLTKITNTQLVVETESGTIVRTNHNLKTIGKAYKNAYACSSYTYEEYEECKGKDIIKKRVSYWNDKKCCSEYR